MKQQTNTGQGRTSAPRGADEGCCAVYYVNENRVGRVRDAMLPLDLVRQVADMFQVLAHPTRLKILRALAREDLCVCDLANVLGLSISATSHQLGAMRRNRIVQYRMDGKLAYYSIRDPFVVSLLDDAVRHLASREGSE